MGPVVDIPLREPLTEDQAVELERWLRSITSRLEGERLDRWPFWIKDGRPIGLAVADCGAACAFGLGVEDTKTEQDYMDEDGWIDPAIQAELEEERAQTLAHLGYHPKQSINIYAGCRGTLDHRILGHLALRLAERYDGIINMDGAIRPPLRPGGRYELDNTRGIP